MVFPNIAKLFRAIAYAEQVHAGNHFNELKDQKGDYTVTAERFLASEPWLKTFREL